ncbi:hypothetical protein P1P68_07125 [Streptomyces scabiei]|uniref:hypothetical protein n=1 Tax=Streptomyces scabiei TaxID=1930 RepID=UPI0029902B19|nr:hypothetical protein [Streptomyces scabiei]MDW8804564.1 hypothetical protein [Streptomyces scabiei]
MTSRLASTARPALAAGVRTTRLEGDGPYRVQIRVVDLRRAKAVEVTRAVRGALKDGSRRCCPRSPRRPSP